MRRRSLIDAIMRKNSTEDDQKDEKPASVKPRVPPIELDNVIVIGGNGGDTESSGSSSSSARKKKGGARSPISKKPQDKIPMVLHLDPSKPNSKWDNSKAMTKKINDRIKRGPSGRDGHGFIYMYKVDKDTLLLYRKIGRTERLPERRIKEWSNALLVESWRCRRNRHAEVLIHWLADRVRLRRYVMLVDEKTGHETMLTVNHGTKQYVQDATYKECIEKKQLPTLTDKGVVPGAKRVYKEWFMADEKTLKHVVDNVVSDINEHWKDEPWSKEMEQMK